MDQNPHSDSSPVRWGIVGTGAMARTAARDLQLLPQAEILAIASRSHANAQAMARELDVPRAYGSLDALCADPEIDLVYIATPNHRHAPDTLAALAAGKGVVVEKPFALHANEARQMVSMARERGLLLMEALWTRFLPGICKLQELLAQGAIGTPTLLQADFGFTAPFDAQSRLYAPELGGSALYDIGVYPLFLAQLLFGAPEHIEAHARLAPTGVDASCTISCRYTSGVLAQCAASFECDLPTEARIMGSQGRLELARMFHMPTKLTLVNNSGQHEIAIAKALGKGYTHQFAAAIDAYRAGQCECPLWTHSQSLALMETLDRVRAAFTR